MGIAEPFFKIGKNKLQKHVLVVDIGSASVSVALVYFENKVSTIISSQTTPIKILSDLTYLQFEKEMQKALIASLDKILRRVKVPLDSINVCLSSPWYASQVRTAKMSRTSQFFVSKSILDDMVKRELTAFEEEEIKTKSKAGEAVRPIESQTIRVLLNGYETHEPLGLNARELELTIFLSVASEHTLKKIEDIISRVFAASIKFSTFLSMTYLVARDYFPHQENYMLLDVGGEVTDISFVKENGLQQSYSFPCGKNYILRRLSEQLKRTIPEAETICSLHAENKTSGPVKDACEDILVAARNEWQILFQQALFHASKDLYVPNTILLTVDDHIAKWFIDTIKTEQYHQNALAGKEFNVIHMNCTFFSDSLSFGPDVVRNSSIMIETLGLRYFFDTNKENNIIA